MPRYARSGSNPSDSEREPATTPEARDSRMSNLAYRLAEQRLREGTASAQETTYFLKLGSQRESLELDKLRGENQLLHSRIKQIEEAGNMLALYDKAIEAMRTYQGHAPRLDELGDEDA